MHSFDFDTRANVSETNANYYYNKSFTLLLQKINILIKKHFFFFLSYIIFTVEGFLFLLLFLFGFTFFKEVFAITQNIK